MKKVVIILAVLFLAIVLVGCTQPNNQNNNADNGQTTPQGNTGTASNDPGFSDGDLSSFEGLLGDSENDVAGLETTEDPPETFPE